MYDDAVQPDAEPNNDPQSGSVIPLAQFISDFGDGLLDAVSRQNPPIYEGPVASRTAIMEGLKRTPFPRQQDSVQAVLALLQEAGERACVINAEMGTGKTIMAIACAAILHAEGLPRTLCIVPPHLTYKWRREILDTVPDARVWVLNGPDTLAKLLKIRELVGKPADGPEFFVLGRVRMRLGFHWRPAFAVRKLHERRQTIAGDERSRSALFTTALAACPHCGEICKQQADDGQMVPIHAEDFPREKRHQCAACFEPLWTLTHRTEVRDRRDLVKKALIQIPTIGPRTADKLLQVFGADALSDMLADNLYEFTNLLDDEGEFVFSDRQAERMEKALGRLEFAFGQGSYQPSEFIKRFLPKDFFNVALVDEGHEYKAAASAQAEAMAVLVSQVKKTVLLTGTLMGGYADDVFYLLWRLLPERFIEDGFTYNASRSLGAAAMAFMRRHGVLRDVFKETQGDHYRTARAKKMTVHTSKAPGFGPQGITRYILPYTVFLKLREIGGDVLPPYEEEFIEVPMAPDQAAAYADLSERLTAILKEAVRKRDFTVLGVVLNVLLRWPDTCFRPETVSHPRQRDLLAFQGAVAEQDDLLPKEEEILRICREEKAQGRRVLLYTVYTGKHDLAAKYRSVLERNGLKAAVLRASVATEKREDWIAEKVDRGVDCLICNPELVKTGLDLYDFPTIVFAQTGYNVYTLQQAARRSWRIGQTKDVRVYYLGYAETAQIGCLALMAKKIAVAQSTAGDMPDSGLDILNQDGDSVEVALARQLAA